MSAPERPVALSKPQISVVIPVFNEEAGLPALFNRLYRALDGMRRTYEVIFVNDGSTDRSAAILRKQFETRSDVTCVILFNTNYGQHLAIMAGFQQARGSYVVTLDADLQNPPEEIPKLLAKMDAGHDYVGGVRTARQDSWFRRNASRLLNHCGIGSRLADCSVEGRGRSWRIALHQVITRLGHDHIRKAVKKVVKLLQLGDKFAPLGCARRWTQWSKHIRPCYKCVTQPQPVNYVARGNSFSLLSVASTKGEAQKRAKLNVTVQGSALTVSESGGCGRTATLSRN